jgi:RNA polymerase sigma-70 factor (ECF subfamily)
VSAFTATDVEAVIPRLRRYARALTGSREAADDLTQDTLERAWGKRALWKPGTNLRAWMFTVMHNVHVNGLKSARRAVAGPGDTEEERLPAASGTSVETGIVLGELRAALAALPDDQRAVVLLVGLEQLSYAEAAEVLGIPAGTVMSRLARGRERLRTLLETGPGNAGRAALLRRVK